MISILPADMLQNVLSFLPLRDNLIYASTSKVSMRNSTREINRRRDNMKCDSVWRDCPQDPKIYYAKESPFKDGKDTYYVPSTLDRLRCLRKSLSYRHPLYDDIHALVTELGINVCEEERFSSFDGCEEESCSFEVTFSTFQRALKVHKLHSNLLRRTIYDEINSIPRNEQSVSIYRFVGDVLIVYFLMGHVAAGIVEGVNESRWIAQLSSIDKGTSTFRRYQRFICYYSTMLQTLPMTSGQMIQMGIANEEIVSKICRGKLSRDRCLLPQSPHFRGTAKKGILDQMITMEDLVALSSILYDFGTFGPAYDDIDDIRFIYLTPARSGIESIEVLHQMPIHHYNYKDNTSEVITRLRSDQFDPLSKLIHLFRDSKRNTPMSFQSGIVTVKLKS